MDKSQTLDRIEIKDRTVPQPAPNRNFLRLYGHTLSPYVERVRLVLASTPYQDCQVNLDSRTKWHMMLNRGMIPILETPADNPQFGKAYTILESRNIMDFLNEQLSLGLYSPDPFLKAEQVLMSDLLDRLPAL